MSDASRRTFLTAAGAGAAAVGIAAFAPGSASAATKPASGSTGLASGEPLVAYVSDASTGELTVMVGEREVHIKNPALVSQLHAATR